MKKMNLNFKEISHFAYSLFHKIGVQESVYTVVVDKLIETSMRGVDTHGIRLIPHYLHAAMIGRINKKPHFKFKKKSVSVGLLDADHGYGIAAGLQAMDYAIKMAKETGVGVVSVKKSSHFGAAAIYGLYAAKQNMIGIVCSDVESLVLPYRGKKPYFGTNPFCFTAPMEDSDPFCLDMATSQVPWNKVMLYRSEKKQLEPGWAADDQGNPTQDAEKAAALSTFGLYKGYGLGMIISILSSLLSGMPYGSHITRMYPLKKKHRNLGHFFMVIDIRRFQSLTSFKHSLKMMSDELHAIPSVVPSQPVLVPGDPEKIMFQKRKKEGIPLTDIERFAFLNIAEELKITKPKWLS